MKVSVDGHGNRILDFKSLAGYSVVNLEPREMTAWDYDDERDLPFLDIDVDFMFKEEPGKFHTIHLKKYVGEDKLLTRALSIYYDGGWIHEDFYFDLDTIKGNKILDRIATQLTLKSKLPVLTKVSFPEPPEFCTDCKYPLGGWQAQNHHKSTCKSGSLKRFFGFVEDDILMMDITFQEAKEIMKERFQDKNYFEKIINSYDLKDKHIQNINSLLYS